MATNRYFKNYQISGEQALLENMLIESIQIFGEDVYYIPRTLNTFNKVYGEDATSSYDAAYMIEMYIKNFDGFGGDGNFMARFGLEVHDQMTFTVAKRVFDDEIGKENNFPRPREGDLIYFPLNAKCFQIKFVNNKPVFFQLGNLPTYDLTCELFAYSGESFNTGIAEIDSIQINLSLNEYDHGIIVGDGLLLVTEDGEYLVDEDYSIETLDPSADNISIQTESDTIMDWTEHDPFSANGTF